MHRHITNYRHRAHFLCLVFYLSVFHDVYFNNFISQGAEIFRAVASCTRIENIQNNDMNVLTAV